VPPAHHGPFKNKRVELGPRQLAYGPARPDTIQNRVGLGLVPLVPGPAVPIPVVRGNCRWYSNSHKLAVAFRYNRKKYRIELLLRTMQPYTEKMIANAMSG
jgi:hypothetical protein